MDGCWRVLGAPLPPHEKHRLLLLDAAAGAATAHVDGCVAAFVAVAAIGCGGIHEWFVDGCAASWCLEQGGELALNSAPAALLPHHHAHGNCIGTVVVKLCPWVKILRRARLDFCAACQFKRPICPAHHVRPASPRECHATVTPPPQLNPSTQQESEK
eukprot:5234742-Amphidinium_carterae.1